MKKIFLKIRTTISKQDYINFIGEQTSYDDFEVGFVQGDDTPNNEVVMIYAVVDSKQMFMTKLEGKPYVENYIEKLLDVAEKRKYAKNYSMGLLHAFWSVIEVEEVELE